MDGAFADTANIDNHLLFANQGNTLPFSVSSKQTEVAIFY
jgi:hypothetical protein